MTASPRTRRIFVSQLHPSSCFVLASFLYCSCLALATFYSRSCHTAGILMSKPRSSLEYGQKQPRVWLEAAQRQRVISIPGCQGTGTVIPRTCHLSVQVTFIVFFIFICEILLAFLFNLFPQCLDFFIILHYFLFSHADHLVSHLCRPQSPLPEAERYVAGEF